MKSSVPRVSASKRADRRIGDNIPVDPKLRYPICTDGQMVCPPEHYGGIPGYYNLVEALGDPELESHEEMLDWIGDYDPEAFSVERVNQVLTPMRRGKASR
jgi:hypothetical protein